MKANTITNRIHRVTAQRMEYIELLNVGTNRIRFTVSSDSYDFQSFARSERWDGASWQPVCDIPGPAMTTPHGTAYASRTCNLPQTYMADRDELLALTLAVLA